MIAIYIVIGVFLGVIGLFVVANYMSKKDNEKFNSSDTPKENFINKGFWPEGFQTQPIEPMWKSETTTRHTFVKGDKKKKEEKSLEVQLEEAVENEDYLLAADLRDQLKKNGKNKLKQK